jgi:hypothetical protein
LNGRRDNGRTKRLEVLIPWRTDAAATAGPVSDLRVIRPEDAKWSDFPQADLSVPIRRSQSGLLPNGQPFESYAVVARLDILMEALYRHLECLLKNRKNESSYCKARWIF